MHEAYTEVYNNSKESRAIDRWAA